MGTINVNMNFTDQAYQHPSAVAFENWFEPCPLSCDQFVYGIVAAVYVYQSLNVVFQCDTSC